MSLQHVAGRIWADTTGVNRGNQGAVILDNEVILIDAGMFHTTSQRIRAFLEQKFDLPFSTLIFTHSHGDHVLGAQAFGEAEMYGSVPMREQCIRNLDNGWNLEVLRDRAEQVRDDVPEFWEAVQNLEIRIPDLTFEEELVIGENQDIVVKHVGGHTAGSAIVIVEPENAVFVGDQIFNGVFPYAGDPTCNPDMWIESLEDVLAADYAMVIPGHGPLCGMEGVEKQLEMLKGLRASVKKTLNVGKTAEDLLSSGDYAGSDLEGPQQRKSSTLEKWFDFYS